MSCVMISILLTQNLWLQTAHDTEVYCVQASSTGRFFATGGTDKKIKLFDAETGRYS